jgi:hypothetical protein
MTMMVMRMMAAWVWLRGESADELIFVGTCCCLTGDPWHPLCLVRMPHDDDPHRVLTPAAADHEKTWFKPCSLFLMTLSLVQPFSNDFVLFLSMFAFAELLFSGKLFCLLFACWFHHRYCFGWLFLCLCCLLLEQEIFLLCNMTLVLPYYSFPLFTHAEPAFSNSAREK